MQHHSMDEVLNDLTYLVGDSSVIAAMPLIPVMSLFDPLVDNFLDSVSKRLLGNKAVKQYPDVVTFAFWIRRASSARRAMRYTGRDGCVRLGRGVVFHVAPSNVPVNFAYSLAAGLYCGNANIVRLPTKSYPQTDIIVQAISEALDEHDNIKPYIALIRYARNRKVNDTLSSYANVRIVWGGDETIAIFRKSPLSARSSEVNFADRFSIAVIDSDMYCDCENPSSVALSFYNDTYLSDQNACTSPRLVAWIGAKKEEAKQQFWNALHSIATMRYELQPLAAVNKLTNAYLSAVAIPQCRIERCEDNYLVRLNIPIDNAIHAEFHVNCGFFYEVDCDNVIELRTLCNDVRCQTITYFGSSNMLMPLVESGIRGVDRIVPVGKSLDFDLIWDGYDLSSALSRSVSIV